MSFPFPICRHLGLRKGWKRCALYKVCHQKAHRWGQRLQNLREEPRFCAAQHNLRASASAGEFAEFIKGVPLKYSAKRAAPSKSRKIAGVSSKQISWTKKISRKIQNRTFGFFPQFAARLGGKGWISAIIKRCALKNRGKREKPLPSKASSGVALKSRLFLLSAQKKKCEPLFLWKNTWHPWLCLLKYRQVSMREHAYHSKKNF